MKQKARRSKSTFEAHICVRMEADGDGSEYGLIVGSPRRPDQIDADDGDEIGVYELREVKTFRAHPTLE